jgi:tight adherence protein C
MRTSLQQRADERGNKAAFKLLFPTVLCLMPAVYLFLLGPSIVAMSDFFTGRDNASIQSTLDNVERLGRAQFR